MVINKEKMPPKRETNTQDKGAPKKKVSSKGENNLLGSLYLFLKGAFVFIKYTVVFTFGLIAMFLILLVIIQLLYWRDALVTIIILMTIALIAAIKQNGWVWFERNATPIGVVITALALVFTTLQTNQQFAKLEEQYTLQYGEPVIELYNSYIYENVTGRDLKDPNTKVQFDIKTNICNLQGKPVFIKSIGFELRDVEKQKPRHYMESFQINQLLTSSECIFVNETIITKKSFSDLIGIYDAYASVSCIYYLSSSGVSYSESEYVYLEPIALIESAFS